MRYFHCTVGLMLALSLNAPGYAQPTGSIHGMPDCSQARPGTCCLVCCLKPWIIPDLWIERSVPLNEVFDPGIDLYDGSGYCAVGEADTLLKFSTSLGKGPVRVGTYEAVRFGPVNKGGPDFAGASSYLAWITGCEPYEVWVGDTLQVESGAMQGPTRRGIDSLISLDPLATYDPVTKTVRGRPFGSPRQVRIAIYDPTVGILDKNRVVINKFMVIFIEGCDDRGNFWGHPTLIQGPCPIPEPDASGAGLRFTWRSEQLRPGDVTGDGRTDLTDLTALIRHLTGGNMSVPASSMDVTGDGAVDLKDLAVLITEVTGGER